MGARISSGAPGRPDVVAEELLTRKEVARLLRKKESWLKYAERRKLIEYVKIGQQIRYRRSAIERYIQEHRVPARRRSES